MSRIAARPEISGHTRVAAVIGDPVAHSLSPAIHNAGYDALGLDWVYVALAVPSGEAGAAVRALPALGLAGVNVTMPHKADAASVCDELTDDAAALGAVNTVVVRGDGTLLGDSTDGPGLVDALRAGGMEPAGAEVLVLGAGGSARGIVLALDRAGARVTVVARRAEAAEAAAALGTQASPGVWSALDELVPRADVVVNATPLGMAGEAPPFDVTALRPGQRLLDTVYHPVETPLLAAARARGIAATNGVGMLVAQAARAFTRFTGVDAPVDAMRAGAERVLARRG